MRHEAFKWCTPGGETGAVDSEYCQSSIHLESMRVRKDEKEEGNPQNLPQYNI